MDPHRLAKDLVDICRTVSHPSAVKKAEKVLVQFVDEITELKGQVKYLHERVRDLEAIGDDMRR